jgi:hypothetical protein
LDTLASPMVSNACPIGGIEPPGGNYPTTGNGINRGRYRYYTALNRTKYTRS